MRIVRPMLLALVASAVLSYNVHAQAPPPILQEPQTIPLWQGRAPGAQGIAVLFVKAAGRPIDGPRLAGLAPDRVEARY